MTLVQLILCRESRAAAERSLPGISRQYCREQGRRTDIGCNFDPESRIPFCVAANPVFSDRPRNEEHIELTSYLLPAQAQLQPETSPTTLYSYPENNNNNHASGPPRQRPCTILHHVVETHSLLGNPAIQHAWPAASSHGLVTGASDGIG